jgi:murein DD-endopeptidase MepM/ murein hydrolase activator NlpD
MCAQYPRSPQGRKVLSRAAYPSLVPPAPRGISPLGQRPMWQQGVAGLLVAGLLVAGLVAWGVATVSSRPAAVNAQEGRRNAQVSTSQWHLSSWQSASFPVENFVAYTSSFGYRQHPFGGFRFHYGLDIAAPLGSYIRAWWAGTVIEVSDDTACGTSIVIQSDHWLHIYCHMQGRVVVESDGDRWLVDREGGLQIRQGDAVTTGQRIGRVGMTGSTTGPHLHWGLKYQSSWVDPAWVLRVMREEQIQGDS